MPSRRTRIVVEFDLMALRGDLASAEKPSDKQATTDLRARVLRRLYAREAELIAELKTAPEGDTLRPYRGPGSDHIAFRPLRSFPEGTLTLGGGDELAIPDFLRRQP